MERNQAGTGAEYTAECFLCTKGLFSPVVFFMSPLSFWLGFNLEV